MAVLTAAVALVLFIAAFAALAWLITASPVILVVVVAATAGFIACVARTNHKDPW